MICHNVDHRFFALKSDAITYARSVNKTDDDLNKIEIKDRYQLAELLDMLCVPVEDRPIERQTDALSDENKAPDCVPQFIINSWKK